jgi:hypothetical protein
MQEILELRINLEFAHLLFGEDEGKNLGTSVKVVEIAKNDPRYSQIPIIQKKVNDENDEAFFFSWRIKRKYDKIDLLKAELFNVRIKSEFEPCGEECGTVYDETPACPVCGAGGLQIGPLFLHKGSISKSDIARTIAGEIVVSDRCVKVLQSANVRGGLFDPVVVERGASNYYQVKITSPELEVTSSTIAGIDPFDLSGFSEELNYFIEGGPSGKFEKEVYKCPRGHTIGLNLLSEVHVVDNLALKMNDLFYTRQRVGVRRGYLRQSPILLCSRSFREIVMKEKLSGFEFEVAHIDQN